MSWLASLGLGFLTAVLSLVGTFLLGLVWVDWLRVSSREGASGYFVAFLALVGAVVGFILGVVVARIVAAGVAPGFLKALGLASGIVIGLLAIITVVCWLLADPSPRFHGHAVKLHAELRAPLGWVKPDPDAVATTWHARIDTRGRTMTSYGNLELKAARREADRWIVPITLDLATSVREKLLYVIMAENVQLFVLPFSVKDEARYRDWSAWQNGGLAPGEAPPPDEQRFTLRYRLEEVVPAPEPAGPSEEEQRVSAQAAEDAALDALTPESPFEESMKFTHYTQGEERRKKAGAVIARRPQVVEELGAEIVSDDAEIADRALRAVPFVLPAPAGLVGPVDRVGNYVIAALERVVALPVAEDPRYQAAADFSVKFAGWFQAHRALHEAGLIDGRPQLQKILTLARQRDDSNALKGDVARIAEHYLKEWNAAATQAKGGAH